MARSLSLRFAVVLGCAALTVSACSTFTGDGGDGDAGSDAATDGGPDGASDGAASAKPSVPCGTMTCSGATPVCCAAVAGAMCIGASDTCSTQTFRCDDRLDCAGSMIPGAICCARYRDTLTDAGPIVLLESYCAAACTAPRTLEMCNIGTDPICSKGMCVADGRASPHEYALCQ